MSQMMFIMMMGMQMMSMLMMVARWRQEWRCSLPIILYIFRQIQMLFLSANCFALIQSFTGRCLVLPCAKLESAHGAQAATVSVTVAALARPPFPAIPPVRQPARVTWCMTFLRLINSHVCRLVIRCPKSSALSACRMPLCCLFVSLQESEVWGYWQCGAMWWGWGWGGRSRTMLFVYLNEIATTSDAGRNGVCGHVDNLFVCLCRELTYLPQWCNLNAATSCLTPSTAL